MTEETKIKQKRLVLSSVEPELLKIKKMAVSTDIVVNLKIPGVYFLFQDETLVYVGQSTHVPTRIESHVREGRLKFNRVAFIKVPPENLLEVEAYYIDLLWPEENRTGDRAEIRKLIEASEIYEG